MLGWLLVAVALAALLLDPGVWGMVAVAVAVLVYLLVRARSWGDVRAGVEVSEVTPDETDGPGDASEDRSDGAEDSP